jgi:hypothetical protein
LLNHSLHLTDTSNLEIERKRCDKRLVSNEE